jgi:alkylated DNA nucleotide flippase Atl1
MAYKKKTWREKLDDDKDLPRVIKLDPALRKRWGAATCVIPAPREVDTLMRTVPKGRVTTINHIREALARRHKAEIGCPICTGIFARVAAGAAEEDRTKGRKNITPYWRTLKAGGIINEKYPGGVARQKKLLQSEGHRVRPKGKNSMVVDFEKRLAALKP